MAEEDEVKPVVLEDVAIRFRNFTGAEGQYNRKGDRNFCVLLDDDTAEAMRQDGWNIKTLSPRDEDEEPTPYIQVKVNFSGPRPPMIKLITSRGQTPLGENEVNILDWADIKQVDLIIRPYAYEVGARKGISAYLQKAYITIVEDALELKYADTPDSASSALSTRDMAPDDED